MDSEKRHITRAVEIVDTSTYRGMGGQDVKRFNNEQNYPNTLGFSSKEEMYGWLEGKKVLDIGSGAGFFAMDEMKEKGKDFSYIVSLNPRLKNKDYRDQLEKERGLHYTSI